MQTNTAEKWVLVTGGAKRVGAEISRFLAGKGYNVILHYLSSHDEASQLKRDIEAESKVKVELVSGDISKEADVKAIFEKFSPDLVVNNAGRFDKYKLESNLDANLRALYYISQCAIERMMADGKKGHIILVGDAFLERGGVYPAEKLLGYTLSKEPVGAAAKALARAYGKKGIRTNAIFNGPIEPPPDINPEMVALFQNDMSLPKEELGPWLGGVRVAEAIWALDEIITGANGSLLCVDGARLWEAPDER